MNAIPGTRLCCSLFKEQQNMCAHALHAHIESQRPSLCREAPHKARLLCIYHVSHLTPSAFLDSMVVMYSAVVG